MTGREKILAALSEGGSSKIGVVIPYEGLYVRDNWHELTTCPWWWQHDPDIDRQLRWRAETREAMGHDWFCLHWFYTRAERERLRIEQQGDRVFRIDTVTGTKTELHPPVRSGWNQSGRVESVQPESVIVTPKQVDEAVPEPNPKIIDDMVSEGRADLARAAMAGYARDLCPISHVNSPLWRCYGLWGFEGLMTMIADQPELVEHACERFALCAIADVHAAALLGAEVVWIEECITDQISPALFGKLNLPYLRAVVDEIRSLRMKSVYYFCGNPAGKWELILSAGADALSLEESKKAFTIDIEKAADVVSGRCTLLGNIDAVGVLQDATERELRIEIERQIAAGRRNGDRFIMSLGSPVTPDTPVERVRLYCDLVREIGG